MKYPQVLVSMMLPAEHARERTRRQQGYKYILDRYAERDRREGCMESSQNFSVS